MCSYPCDENSHTNNVFFSLEVGGVLRGIIIIMFGKLGQEAKNGYREVFLCE
jgi:hypothetical protein